MSLIRKITIIMPVKRGFHLRVLSRFVGCVQPFKSAICIRKGAIKVNGKSIMGLLALAAPWKSTLHIEIEGEDAEELAEVIKVFFQDEAAAEIVRESDST